MAPAGIINANEWISEGVKTNPLAATVLAEFQNTSSNAESHRLRWVISASVAGTVVMEHMEDDNLTVLRSHSFPISAGLPFESMNILITLAAGQRIRVRTGAVLVGQIQCSMFIDQ